MAKHGIARENYYKGKCHPAMGRGIDGDTDIHAYFYPLGPIANIKWVIDRDRRNPEDQLSMQCCESTRELYESDKAFDEYWTPDASRHNLATTVWSHYTDTDQSRYNG